MHFNNIRSILFICTMLLIIIDVCFDVNFPKVEKSIVRSDKINGSSMLKILQISDVHGYNKQSFILNAVKSNRPDIIVITGDLIDKRTAGFEDLYTLADELIKLNSNVFFVSGNHERWHDRGKEFVRSLSEKKIKVLNNSNAYFMKDSIQYNICGIDDYYSGLDDLGKAFQGIDEKNYTVLLSHSPTVVEQIDSIKADLVLSGHAHGGQVRLPFIGALIAPGEGLFPKYSKGFYSFNDKVLYVDSGLGTSVLPLRFLNRSQISLIEIKSK